MKKITAILAVLAIGFIFVGCGPKEEAATTGDAGATTTGGTGTGAGGDASKANPDTPK